MHITIRDTLNPYLLRKRIINTRYIYARGYKYSFIHREHDGFFIRHRFLQRWKILFEMSVPRAKKNVTN